MKKILVLFLAAGAAISASALDWMTDFAKAEAKAKAEKKLVLMDFTGSDWCPWCIKLEKEILDTDDFRKFAKDNLVLVYVDFPKQKEQSEEQKQANKTLAAKYKVEGFPTVVVLDKDGKKVGELGYEEGGPKPFIAQLEKLAKTK